MIDILAWPIAFIPKITDTDSQILSTLQDCVFYCMNVKEHSLVVLQQ